MTIKPVITSGVQPHLPDQACPQQQEESYPIVGVGASAGGLKALRQLLEYLPDQPGLALVVVQHLDPGQESGLVNLLARVTRMPVSEAGDEMAVEMDHVYVIPPGRAIRFREGALHTTPRGAALEPQRLIDLFLTSLAEECRQRSVGVVLSGTGMDGTRGLENIKAEGGLTYAQDSSAAHGGMPLSAIQAGCVDFVLSPMDIATELTRLGANGLVPAACNDEDKGDEEAALGLIFRLLRSSNGVDFSQYKQGTLRRRLGRRMAVKNAMSIANYASLVQEEPDELQALFEDILIHVTRFFRDPDTFKALTDVAFPAVLSRRQAGESIRIWVPGCSTGEEVYSLAMVLLEYLEEKGDGTHSIRVFGTDVSDRVVARARSGWFDQHIATEVSPERLRRFFVSSGDGYRVCKDVREMCVFARHDATRDPPFSQLDLISCRNVLIYLGTALKDRALPMFHYALNEGGFLLLGTSESVGSASDLFSVANQRQGLHVRKAAPVRMNLDGLGAGIAAQGRSYTRSATTPHLGTARDMLREVDRFVLARTPAGVVVDESLNILQFRGDTGLYLLPPAGEPTRSLLAMAREGLTEALRSTIEEAQRLDAPARRSDLSVHSHEGWRKIDLCALPIPLPDSSDRCLLVQFEPEASEDASTAASPPATTDGSPATAARVSQLERELAGSRDYLRGIIANQQSNREEIEVANEEMLSSNEELQSTNEELQTAKEELQATNEELLTVNEELAQRNQEGARLNDDLSNLLTSVRIPIVMLGRDLRIRRFTPAAGQLLNLIPNDVGRPIAHVAPSLRVEDLVELISGVISTLKSCEREVQARDGRWHALSIRPYRTLDDGVDGAVISLVDIDAAKRSEQRIAAARDYAESIVTSVHEPLVVLDSSLRIKTANPAFHAAFLSTPESVGDQSILAMHEGRWDTPELQQEFKDLAAGGSPFKDFEATLEHPNGETRTLLLNARPVDAGRGGEGLFLLAMEDVTVRRRENEERLGLERKLQEAQRLESLGVLAGGIAHDFNNLLTSILGHADLAALNALEGSELREHLDRIEEGVDRASALCDQMLAYSGRGTFVMAPVELNAVVDDASRLMALAIGSRAVLQLELASTSPVVHADSTQLGQVLMNLLLNGSEAMGDGGGLVTVSTGVIHADELDFSGAVLAPDLVEGEYAYLEVKDQGSGMDAETLRQVFDPFFTTKFTGRGLGLAAVHGIVRRHGGALKIESEVGRGSTFQLLLPNSTESLAVEPTVSPAPDASTEDRGAILVVDDETEVLAAVADLVQSLGFEVIQARGGLEALEAFRARKNEIRLVLLDLAMPDLGGADTLTRLRELSPNVDVLLMSGHDEEEALKGLSSTTLGGFLRKPFGLRKLSAALNAVLGHG